VLLVDETFRLKDSSFCIVRATATISPKIFYSKVKWDETLLTWINFTNKKSEKKKCEKKKNRYMTDLVFDFRKVNAHGGDTASSICDLAGLDPSSASPCDMTVTHLGSESWVVPKKIPAFVVRNLLTKQECDSIIAATPSNGSGFMNEKEVASRYRGRTCTRLASHDPSMSSLIERRLRELDLLPSKLDGGELLGVSPRWRHVHYKGAQRGHQEHHIDGREPLPAEKKEAGTYRQSRLTCMVYLNTAGVDFEGGSTTFLDDALKPRQEHKPIAGDCICFYQENYANRRSLLLHQGSDVTDGDKRMMRTVVDYGGFSKADCRRCLWADALDVQEADMLAEVDRKLAAKEGGVPPRVTARVTKVVAAASASAAAAAEDRNAAAAAVEVSASLPHVSDADVVQKNMAQAFQEDEDGESARTLAAAQMAIQASADAATAAAAAAAAATARSSDLVLGDGDSDLLSFPPIKSELLFILIFLFGGFICLIVYSYDIYYNTSIYPNSVYGGDDKYSHEQESYRSGIGAINCFGVSLVCFFLFRCCGQSSISQGLSVAARLSDPRTNPPSMNSEKNK